MITYSIINKSQLEGAMRLDAEFYQPEYLDLISKIKSHKSKFIGEIGLAVYGTTPSGGIFEEKGIPFIRSQNFSNLLITTSDLVFCSKKFHNQNKKSAIKPGDILFAAVGATIGELAIVQDEIKEGNINQNIAAVRITDKNVNPYFVGFFFASISGQLQIERPITGNAQPYLNSEQIKSFLIPIFDIKRQNEIANYFHEVQKQIKNSEHFYSQAEELLLEELGLFSFVKATEDEERFNIVNLSEVKSAHRADAEYFQSKYDKLFSNIKKQNAKLLGDLVLMKKGIEPGSEQYQEGGMPFIRVSNLSRHGIIDKDQKYLSDDLYQKLGVSHEPKVGEVLLTKDATPGIAYTIQNEIKGIISSGILRLKIRDNIIDPEFLTLIINSLVGKLQAERDAGGSIIAHWKPDQIKNVLIPILPRSIQQKIADLVRKSHLARQKSKQLLEEARRKVEEMIEKG